MPRLKRRIKVNQTKTEELPCARAKAQGGIQHGAREIKQLGVARTAVFLGKRSKLPWSGEERCALSIGLTPVLTELTAGNSCLGEWAMVWTKDKEEDLGGRGPRRP